MVLEAPESVRMRVSSLIGEGEWSTLFSASNPQHEPFALKVYQRQHVQQQEDARKRALTERLAYEVLEQLPSPFIVRMHMAFEDESNLYLGLQLAGGQDLLSMLQMYGPIPGTKARFCAAEISLALGHMHSLDLVYRNLSPEHVLVGLDGHAMLCDLSMVHFLQGRDGAIAPPEVDFELEQGFPEYLPYEMVMGAACCETTDFWCLGCLMSEMLTGSTPFANNDDGSDEFRFVLRRIIQGNIEHLRHHGNVGPVEFDLLCQLLKPKPEQRLGARPRGYHSVLAHPWFAGLTEDTLLRKLVEPPFASMVIDRCMAPAVPEDIVAAHATGVEAGPPSVDFNALAHNPQALDLWSTETNVQITLHTSEARVVPQLVDSAEGGDTVSINSGASVTDEGAPMHAEPEPVLEAPAPEDPAPEEPAPEEQEPAQDAARDEAPKAEEQVTAFVSPVSVLDTSDHQLADGASKPAACLGWEARHCA